MEAEEKRLEFDKTRGQLDQLAWVLDNFFRIPGTNWRFGLEAVIGLIPGAGDVVSGLLALLLLIRAFQFDLPKIVMVRMILNTVLDITIGAIPLVGDAFDFFFKSNTRNMRLFHQYAEEPQRSTLRHWIFIGSILFGFVTLMILIIVAFVLLFMRLFQIQ